jgi:GNAT superfamily N-acetyltransferase
MIVREFKKTDITSGLLETLQEVWSISEISESTINDFLSNDNHLYVVENDKGEVIGSATLHVQKKLIRNGGIAGFLEDVVIREEYRNNGVGSLLVQKIIEKSKELNCYKLVLSCFPERTAFYERNGFFKESINMRNNLK